MFHSVVNGEYPWVSAKTNVSPRGDPLITSMATASAPRNPLPDPEVFGVAPARPLFGANPSPCPSKRSPRKSPGRRAPTGCELVVTMNLDHIVRLRHDQAFRCAYQRAWAVTIDGAPVFAYARLRGSAAPGRVTGADLVEELAAALPTTRRIFFVVSKPETGDRLAELFRARGFPADALAHVSPPFGFEKDEAQSATLLASIRAHRATDLVFGLGAPKSEVWIDRHREEPGQSLRLWLRRGPRLPRRRRCPGAPDPATRGTGMALASRSRSPAPVAPVPRGTPGASSRAVAQDLAGRAPHGGRRLQD